jgi:hypothetical protein
MRRSLVFISVILLVSVLFSGCIRQARQHTDAIKVADVKGYLSDSFPTKKWVLSKCNCIQPTDTLIRNLPYSFDEAMLQIKQEFTHIDTLNTNKATKEYLKSLVLADFTYAAFSFQFLGPKFGLATDSTYLNILARWDTMSLRSCYDIGNLNITGLYCGQRTSFYLRLVDSLLGIKGYQVVVPYGVHIFPVVNLSNGPYVMDPYDPFVICDSTKQTVISYSQLLSGKNDGNFVPIRSARLFGTSRQLFSARYVSMLRDSSGAVDKNCFCCMLKNYLTLNEAKLVGSITPCFVMPEEPLFEDIKVIAGDRNLYAMGMTGRVDGPLVSHNDIVWHYIGTDCGSKK